jgi:hypothetical protein
MGDNASLRYNPSMLRWWPSPTYCDPSEYDDLHWRKATSLDRVSITVTTTESRDWLVSWDRCYWRPFAIFGLRSFVGGIPLRWQLPLHYPRRRALLMQRPCAAIWIPGCWIGMEGNAGLKTRPPPFHSSCASRSSSSCHFSLRPLFIGGRLSSISSNSLSACVVRSKISFPFLVPETGASVTGSGCGADGLLSNSR